MKGTVEVNGLKLFARHGVFEQERTVGNKFEVTLRATYPMERAMTLDDLDGTLNYAEAVGIIKEQMAIPAALLEHVAWRIKEALCRRFPLIESGEVRIAKLAPPIPAAELDSVAVTITW